MKKEKLRFLKPKEGNSLGQWLIEEGISAGFPSPADDFKEVRISLDEELVSNKDSTFYARVCGNSMENAGISDGDLLIIDRSLEYKNNKIAVCFINGEFTVKRIIKKGSKIFLKPENKNYKEIELKDDNELILWGIVTYVIKSIKWQDYEFLLNSKSIVLRSASFNFIGGVKKLCVFLESNFVVAANFLILTEDTESFFLDINDIKSKK